MWKTHLHIGFTAGDRVVSTFFIPQVMFEETIAIRPVRGKAKGEIIPSRFCQSQTKPAKSNKPIQIAVSQKISRPTYMNVWFECGCPQRRHKEMNGKLTQKPHLQLFAIPTAIAEHWSHLKA